MDFNDVEDYLKNWGLSHHISNFKEQAINDEVFMALDQETINILFPLLGERIIFKRKYADLKSSNLLINSSFCPPQEWGAAHQNLNQLLQDQNNDPNIEQLTQNEVNDANSTDNSNTPDVHYKSTGLKRKSPLKSLDLRDILTLTKKGECVLLYFEKHNKLNSESRNLMVDILVEFIFDNEISVNHQVFMDISLDICQTFPGEVKEIYYCPSGFDKENYVNSSGKLYYKYKSKKRFYNKRGVNTVSIRSCKKPKPSGNENEYTDQEAHLLWLNNSVDPWSAVEIHWEASYNLRQTLALTIPQYFDKIPALTLPTGYVLLEKDFRTAYPEKETCLFETWPILQTKLVAFYGESTILPDDVNVLKSPQSSADAKVVSVLRILASLLPQASQRISKKLSWKPSALESFKGLILHIQDARVLSEQLEARFKAYDERGITTQPFIVICGPTISDIRSSFAVINKSYYRVPTVLKALDCIVKTSFAMNTEYQFESYSICLFIQKYCYGLSSAYDKNVLKVEELLVDLKQ